VDVSPPEEIIRVVAECFQKLAGESDEEIWKAIAQYNTNDAHAHGDQGDTWLK
jgi:hypothetical protein